MDLRVDLQFRAFVVTDDPFIEKTEESVQLVTGKAGNMGNIGPAEDLFESLLLFAVPVHSEQFPCRTFPAAQIMVKKRYRGGDEKTYTFDLLLIQMIRNIIGILPGKPQALSHGPYLRHPDDRFPEVLVGTPPLKDLCFLQGIILFPDHDILPSVKRSSGYKSVPVCDIPEKQRVLQGSRQPEDPQVIGYIARSRTDIDHMCGRNRTKEGVIYNAGEPQQGIIFREGNSLSEEEGSLAVRRVTAGTMIFGRKINRSGYHQSKSHQQYPGTHV